jgi:tetratricopeptide (TPR) repeat protein
MIRMCGWMLMLASVIAAAPRPANDVLRAAEAAMNRGDFAAARIALERAAADTADPGYVSFQRSIAASEQGDWAAAVLAATQCLDDDNARPERIARALYNRSVARIMLGEYREAIRDLSACQRIGRDDELLRDARINLEIAKLRWRDARLRSAAKDAHGDETTEPNPSTASSESGSQSSDPSAAKPDKQTLTAQAMIPKADLKSSATATDKRLPGRGTLPVIKDDAVLVPMTATETAAHLEAIAERLRAQRRTQERLRSSDAIVPKYDW